jgi:hypothetical protein
MAHTAVGLQKLGNAFCMSVQPRPWQITIFSMVPKDIKMNVDV